MTSNLSGGTSERRIGDGELETLTGGAKPKTAQHPSLGYHLEMN